MPKPPARCGTDSGYYRHKRTTHTDPCPPCLAAHSEAQSARQRRRRVVTPRKPAKRSTVPCRCGAPSETGRCRPCWNEDRDEQTRRQRAERAERAAAELAYEGEWVPVRGILRPVAA